MVMAILFLVIIYSFIPSQPLYSAVATNVPIKSKMPISSNSIKIFGEVLQPGAYPVVANQISLTELVKADTESIVILRGNNGNRMITYANSEVGGLSGFDNIFLKDTDVVFIESLDSVNGNQYKYKKSLPFVSAFLCVIIFLFSAFKG